MDSTAPEERLGEDAGPIPEAYLFLSIEPLFGGKPTGFDLQGGEGWQNRCIGQVLGRDCAKFLRVAQ